QGQAVASRCLQVSGSAPGADGDVPDRHPVFRVYLQRGACRAVQKFQGQQLQHQQFQVQRQRQTGVDVDVNGTREVSDDVTNRTVGCGDAAVIGRVNGEMVLLSLEQTAYFRAQAPGAVARKTGEIEAVISVRVCVGQQ